jgi:hypothetical protein
MGNLLFNNRTVRNDRGQGTSPVLALVTHCATMLRGSGTAPPGSTAKPADWYTKPNCCHHK